MESFLLFCDGTVVLLVVVLMMMDNRRKPGVPRRSPFRINELMRTAEIKRSRTYERPMPTRRRRQP